MPIPSFRDWKTWTDVPFSFRSSELKKVDSKLEEYWKNPREPLALVKLRRAWKMWKRLKGSGNEWKRSERNNKVRDLNGRYHIKGICEEMDDALALTVQLSPQDLEILKWQDRQRRQAIWRMFHGKKITLVKKHARLEAGKALHDLKSAAGQLNTAGVLPGVGGVGGASGAGGAAAGVGSAVAGSAATGGAAVEAVTSMLGDMFDVSTVAAILPDLTVSFGGDLISAVVPVLGHLKSGAKVVASWGKVVKAAYKSYSIATHGYGFREGDAAAAFASLQVLLGRATDIALAKALIASADFGARGVGALLDGGAATGPLIGAATALANLCQRIALFAIEYRETAAANAILANDLQLDFRLFNAKPLLGCYMICCSTLSDIITMSQVQFGAADWMDDIEYIKKKHIDPVRQAADGYIRKSPYEIVGLSSLVKRGKVSDATYLAALA